jgi:hypothetical protein
MLEQLCGRSSWKNCGVCRSANLRRKPLSNLTSSTAAPRINTEVHAGWCSPRTSNPVGPPPVDRSVRFRLTSAISFSVASRVILDNDGDQQPPYRARGVYAEQMGKARKVCGK